MPTGFKVVVAVNLFATLFIIMFAAFPRGRGIAVGNPLIPESARQAPVMPLNSCYRPLPCDDISLNLLVV